MNSSKTANKNMVLLAMFIAIELVLAFVPNLGFITMPMMQITTMHIPVIICGVVMGTREGAITGFIFGLASFINATFLLPNPIISPIFTPFYSNAAFESNWTSLLICFVPRILVGVVAAVVYKALKKNLSSRSISVTIAAVLASFTNTALVLGGTFLFFGEQYAASAGISIMDILAGVISINGLLEAVFAAILTVAISSACFKVIDKR